MKNEFVGIIYGFGQKPGITGQIVPRGTDMEVRFEGATLGTLPYVGIRISLTGVDDKFICFEADVDGKEIRLLVPDKEIADQIAALGGTRALLDQLNQVKSARTKRKAGRAGVMVAGLIIFLVICGSSWAGFKWATAAAVDAIPVDWELELGRSTAGDLLTGSMVCADPELNRAIAEIGYRLVGGLGTSPYAFKLRVIDSDDVNAYALPGGYVFVNRGLIQKSQDGAEVAGVLAHEMEHVLHRHGIGNLVRQAGLMLIVAMVFGDAGQMEQFLMYNAAGLAGMSFSRDQELEADSEGLSLMYKSALDPTGLPRFLKKLADDELKLGPLFTMLSTHPATDDRINRLNQTITSWPQTTPTPLTSDWSKIKTLCGPVQITDPDAP